MSTINQVALFTEAESAVVVYDAGKAGVKSISPEGALFKGGKALKSLKDAAMDSAVNKAVNGRYRAAAEIIGAAFGGFATAFERVIGPAHVNKDNMRTFLAGIERTTPPAGKEFSTKQKSALALVAVLREIPALSKVAAVDTDVVSVQ